MEATLSFNGGGGGDLRAVMSTADMDSVECNAFLTFLSLDRLVLRPKRPSIVLWMLFLSDVLDVLGIDGFDR